MGFGLRKNKIWMKLLCNCKENINLIRVKKYNLFFPVGFHGN